jgi:hypothetical protein
MRFKDGYLAEDGVYYIASTDTIIILKSGSQAFFAEGDIPVFNTISNMDMSIIPIAFTEESCYLCGLEKLSDLDGEDREIIVTPKQFSGKGLEDDDEDEDELPPPTYDADEFVSDEELKTIIKLETP